MQRSVEPNSDRAGDGMAVSGAGACPLSFRLRNHELTSRTLNGTHVGIVVVFKSGISRKLHGNKTVREIRHGRQFAGSNEDMHTITRMVHATGYQKYVHTWWNLVPRDIILASVQH